MAQLLLFLSDFQNLKTPRKLGIFSTIWSYSFLEAKGTRSCIRLHVMGVLEFQMIDKQITYILSEDRHVLDNRYQYVAFADIGTYRPIPICQPWSIDKNQLVGVSCVNHAKNNFTLCSHGPSLAKNISYMTVSEKSNRKILVKGHLCATIRSWFLLQLVILECMHLKFIIFDFLE